MNIGNIDLQTAIGMISIIFIAIMFTRGLNQFGNIDPEIYKEKK